jgi:argininosuccinate lyase
LAAIGDGQKKGCDLPDLSLEAMQTVHGQISAQVFDALEVQNPTKSRMSYGGTAPVQVRGQIARWKEVLV